MERKGLLILLVFLAVACFNKRKNDENESVGETTNEAVNPLMDGDADAEESPLSIKEVETDDDFVRRVGVSDYAEIVLARLALEKSGDKGLKDFANLLEADHEKSLNSLESVVQRPKLNIPEGPDEEAEEKTDRLRQISETEEFNEEWLEEIISMHQSSIDLLESHKNKAENQEVKKWIDNALPTIRMHLDKALALEKRIDG